MENLRTYDEANVSESTIELSYKILKFATIDKSPQFKNLCIHTSDSVQLGYISPLEAMEIIEYITKTGYVPEFVTVRRSNHEHLF